MNMTQTSLSSASSLIQAAKRASDLVNMYIGPLTVEQIIQSQKDTVKSSKISNENNRSYSGECTDSRNSPSSCSKIPHIEPREYPHLEKTRSDCRKRVMESMKVLDDAFSKYQYVFFNNI